MVDDADGRIGEGWSGEIPNGAHINVVIARRGSPTAAAIATVLGSPRPGHTPFLACLGAGTVVRPTTVVVNKTALQSETLSKIMWGAGQLGIGQGVLDAVADGIIDPATTGEILLLVAAWIDPAAHDETAVRKAVREATRTAIEDGLNPPAADAVLALAEKRHAPANAYYTGE